jgi:hypothetical protein
LSLLPSWFSLLGWPNKMKNTDEKGHKHGFKYRQKPTKLVQSGFFGSLKFGQLQFFLKTNFEKLKTKKPSDKPKTAFIFFIQNLNFE